jgi:hypothetical protein
MSPLKNADPVGSGDQHAREHIVVVGSANMDLVKLPAA